MDSKHLSQIKSLVKNPDSTFGFPATMQGNIRDERKRLNRGLTKIDKLRREGIPLKHIETNDWENSSNPAVYVSTPYPKHRTRKVWKAYR
jgi:hypothetical protein